MGQSTEELKAEIEQTRQSMTTDVDALQDRVSPSAIVERRKQAARSRPVKIAARIGILAYGITQAWSLGVEATFYAALPLYALKGVGLSQRALICSEP